MQPYLSGSVAHTKFGKEALIKVNHLSDYSGVISPLSIIAVHIFLKSFL
jgi:hypothetical protein